MACCVRCALGTVAEDGVLVMSRYVELGRFKMINDCHFYRVCFNKVYIYVGM